MVIENFESYDIDVTSFLCNPSFHVPMFLLMPIVFLLILLLLFKSYVL